MAHPHPILVADDPARARGDLHALVPAEFLHRHLGPRTRPTRVRTEPLRGGLDSAGVTRVMVDYLEAPHPERTFTFVVKELEGSQAREATVYQHLASSQSSALTPGLLGVHQAGPRCRLYLEALRPSRGWPWSEEPFTRQVIRTLARVHASPSAPARAMLADWDYEASLQASAAETLELARQVAHRDGFAFVRRSLPALRRLVADLPEIRRALLGFTALEPALLHGDVHSGNVIVTHRAGAEVPLLLDWGRARVGSPLEDVSSWLLSLSLWEPAVRRRHDSLLSAYLLERGLSPRLVRELRDMYWLAGASNLLAGAIRYHLSVAIEASEGKGGDGQTALRAAQHWLRIIRCADGCWRARQAGGAGKGQARASTQGGRGRGGAVRAA